MGHSRTISLILVFGILGGCARMTTVSIPDSHPANAKNAGGPFMAPPSLLTDMPRSPVEQRSEGGNPAPHGGHRMNEGGHAGHGNQPQADAETQARIDSLTKSFTQFNDKLSQDRVEGTGKDLQAIRDAASGLAKSNAPVIRAVAELILTAIPEGAAPAELAALRESLKRFSGATIELMRKFPPSGKEGKAYEAYCPMAKASWVQSSDQIKNPYFGNSMLTCGTIKGSLTRTEP